MNLETYRSRVSEIREYHREAKYTRELPQIAWPKVDQMLSSLIEDLDKQRD